MARGLQTMNRGDQWWAAPVQQESLGVRRQREGERGREGGMEGGRALLCKWIVRWLTSATQVCVRKLFVGSHSSPAWSTPIPRLVETVAKDETRYRQSQPTWLFFLCFSLYLFMHLNYRWSASFQSNWLNDNRVDPYPPGSKRVALFSLEF